MTVPRLSFLPTDVGFNQYPYAAYAQMHRQAPVFFWPEYDQVCFAGFDAVNRLLRDKRLGREILHVASRKELGIPEVPEHLREFYAFESHSMLEREPPVHTRLRRLVNRAFVSRQVERLREPIETLANELIDGFEGQGSCDLLAEFATPIPVCIIADMLGVPREMTDQMLDWSHKMVAMYHFNRTRADEDAAVKATIEFSAYIRSLVDDRRGKSQLPDDLISHLMEAESDGTSLSTAELITSVILLLNAGHEATVHSIGNGVKAILEEVRDPKVLFDGAAAIDETVEEVLRFDAPLHMFSRYVLEDFEFDGVALTKGQQIGLLLGAANRDPLRFKAPDKFDPKRNDQGLVSFGGGIHFCIGAPLARLELQVVLPVLFKRLPDLKLISKPIYSDRYHFHGLEALQVAW